MMRSEQSAKNCSLGDTTDLTPHIRRLTISGAAATAFSKIISYFLQMIGVIILARLLTPRDFGLVAMVMSISEFFQMYSRMGLTDAIVQAPEISENQMNTLFWVNLFFSFLLTISLILLSPLIAWAYQEPKLITISIITAFGFSLAGLSTQHLAVLRRTMKFTKIAHIEIVASLISVIVSVVMAMSGLGYWAIVARPLMLALATTVGAWLFCLWRPMLPSFHKESIPLLKFGMHVLGNYTTNYLSRNVDKMLIGMRYGAQALGYYHKAYHLFLAPINQSSIAITTVAVSSLSRLLHDPKRYRRFYEKAVSLLLFTGSLLSAILVVTSEDLISLLLGSQWMPVAKIFAIFAFGIGVQMIYATTGWLHISLGKPDRWFKWSIFWAFSTITCYLISLPFGPFAVALSFTAVSYILILPSIAYAGKPIAIRLLPILFSILTFSFCAVAAGCLAWYSVQALQVTSMAYLMKNIFFRIIFSSLSCTIFYLIFVVVIFRNRDVVTDVCNICRELINRNPSNV